MHELSPLPHETSRCGRSSSKEEDSENSDDTTYGNNSEEGSQARPSSQRAKLDLIRDAQELFH